MKFRKKPVVIEASQYTGHISYGSMCAAWGAAFKENSYEMEFAQELQIKTLEGEHRANLGDWIIKGIKGEFYPCKPDIFEATYDPLPESPPTESGKGG